MFVSIWFTFMAAMPNVVATLRSVDMSHRSLALGIQSIILRYNILSFTLFLYLILSSLILYLIIFSLSFTHTLNVSKIIPMLEILQSFFIINFKSKYFLQKTTFWFRLIGSIPGPVFFGAIIDQTCILFSDNCLFYDNYRMSLYMMLIVVLVKLVRFSISFKLLILKSNNSKVDCFEILFENS